MIDQPPESLVRGCNDPVSIGILSDWIEEQYGIALDLDRSGWSDGYGNSYGLDNGNAQSFVNGNGHGHQYGDIDGEGRGIGCGWVNVNSNGYGCGYGINIGDGYGYSWIYGNNSGNGTGNGFNYCSL